MKHHYWEAPIVIYLFLGGLGGGIMFLTAIFDFFVVPGVPELFAWPMFIALAALAVGCFFLVFELGQPLVFWRVWTTATAIIKWGATLLVIAMLAGALWWASFLPWDWFSGIAGFLAGGRGVFLALAGIAGFGIMVYTGVMLSTLKAHAFWATPALPVLFTISATSTACAAIALGLGGWPVEFSLLNAVAGELIHAILHIVDIVLVCAEITVLLIMVLSFLGAGNKTSKAVARRWVVGKTAPLFWIGMIGFGLVLPLVLYIGATGPAAEVVAPVLVLLGGLLLRYLCVYSDERAEIPGETRYYTRISKGDEQFVTAWKDGE
ncbi:MAG: NrfD/PsrC family molybdoenzyme membrane anchor subunit, partial [Raoultibacter sp.]